jgi:hypothetical protein
MDAEPGRSLGSLLFAGVGSRAKRSKNKGQTSTAADIW